MKISFDVEIILNNIKEAETYQKHSFAATFTCAMKTHHKKNKEENKSQQSFNLFIKK